MTTWDWIIADVAAAGVVNRVVTPTSDHPAAELVPGVDIGGARRYVGVRHSRSLADECADPSSFDEVRWTNAVSASARVIVQSAAGWSSSATDARADLRTFLDDADAAGCADASELRARGLAGSDSTWTGAAGAVGLGRIVADADGSVQVLVPANPLRDGDVHVARVRAETYLYAALFTVADKPHAAPLRTAVDSDGLRKSLSDSRITEAEFIVDHARRLCAVQGWNSETVALELAVARAWMDRTPEGSS